MLRTLGLLIGALAASGCAQHYAFRPAENATASVSGIAAASYPLPPEAPRGDVRLASLGIVKLRPHGTTQFTRVLHVRMVVDNMSDAPWTIDTRQQQVLLDSHRCSPSYMSGAGAGPLVTVAQGGRAEVNLFYKLPAGLEKASRLSGFDALWAIDAGKQHVAMRTPFDRIPGELPTVGPAPITGWRIAAAR